MAFNPQDIQKANFDAVIKLASDQARKFKDNPDKSKKYEDEKKKLQQAKARKQKDKIKQDNFFWFYLSSFCSSPTEVVYPFLEIFLNTKKRIIPDIIINIAIN